MNREFVLKVIAVIGALFIGYLWSGGIWEYKTHENIVMRSNKLTGYAEVLYESKWKHISRGGDL